MFSLSTCGVGAEVPYLNGLCYLSAVEEAEEVPCSNSPRASLNHLSACGLGAEVPCSNSILWQVSQRVAAFPYAIE